MTVKESIECWVFSEDKTLLLTVPGKVGKRPAFNQPITGGIELRETPEIACAREIFEETGMAVDTKDISKVKDQFVVKIDDRLTIHKTIFTFKTDVFTPILSPEEHIGYQWVRHVDVTKQLFYQSNRDTWSLVLAPAFRKASNDRNTFKEIEGEMKNIPQGALKI